jgi:PAS domain S-box-containing protein
LQRDAWRLPQGQQSVDPPLRERAAFQAGEVRRLLEQAPGFIAVLRGPDQTVEMVNAACSELIGHREVIGLPIREALPELGDTFFDLLSRVYTTGQAAMGRGRSLGIRRDPGRPMENRFIDYVFQPIIGADGSITGIFLQGHDVTDQKRTEEQLRLALEGGRIAAWERDLTTDYVTWSENAWDLLGIKNGPAAEFLARVHPEDRQLQREALARVLSDEAPYSIQVRFFKPDGSMIWIEHRAKVQKGPNGFRSLAGITADVTARRTAEDEVRESEARYRKDLEAAASVQRGLLPSDGVVQTIRHQGLLHPCSVIGGDTLNVIRHGDGRLSFFHIDVCGHGAAAALVSVAAHHLISQAAVRGASLTPEELVRQAARDWPQDLPFFTMIYGQIDSASGQGSLVQAGHPHPLLIRPDGSITPLGQGGLPIGIDMDAIYEPVPFALGAGEAVLLYSDGIVEAENAAGEIFSEERLCRLVGEQVCNPALPLLEAIEQEVLRWRGGARLEDDVSALLLERL